MSATIIPFPGAKAPTRRALLDAAIKQRITSGSTRNEAMDTDLSTNPMYARLNRMIDERIAQRKARPAFDAVITQALEAVVLGISDAERDRSRT